MIEYYNEDCMEGMKRYPDKHFQLAICDPPYGIDINMNMGLRKGKRLNHARKEWDNSAPDDAYFAELFRVSSFQIIWGGELLHAPAN